MKTETLQTLPLIFVMGAVIFFCRVLPFVLFRSRQQKTDKLNVFLSFIEKIVPPATMTVLAFNSIAIPLKANLSDGITVLAASVLTVLVHLWRRNALISIFCGTAAYIIFSRFILW